MLRIVSIPTPAEVLLMVISCRQKYTKANMACRLRPQQRPVPQKSTMILTASKVYDNAI